MNTKTVLGVPVALGVMLIAALGTEYTTTRGGSWLYLPVWGDVGSYPQAFDDVANINHSTVTIEAACPTPLCTAYVNPGGTLQLKANGAVRVLHLQGGSVDVAGRTWSGQGGTGQVHIAGTSYWKNGALGSATDRYVVHGSGTLVVTNANNFTFYAAAGTDFTGTIIVANDTGKLANFPYAESLCNLHVATNRTAVMGEYLVYTNRTMSGRGALWTYNGNGRSFTFGSGSVLRPGDPAAPDSAVFTLKCYEDKGTKILFDPGSRLVLDITDAQNNDRIESIDALANNITISPDAQLEINLFKPKGEVAIADMVLWNANASLSGMFGESNIHFNNADGWRNLEVTKSADGKQILFSGESSTIGTVIVVM